MDSVFLSAIICVICGFAALTAAARPAPVSYRRQVAPLLAGSCNACHGGKTPQSRLITGSYAALMKGGSRGRAVIPANADGSLLVQYIEGRKQPQMPIGGALKPDEIALVRRWIAEGAKFDGEPAGGAAPKVTAVRGALAPVTALAWSRDGSLLAVGGYREVKLFAEPEGRLGATLGGMADAVRALEFSPDGGLLAAAGGLPGQNGEIRLWRVPGSTAASATPITATPVASEEAHADAIYALTWRPDGKRLATGSYDKTVIVWDAAAPDRLRQIAELRDHADAVYAVAYSANGKYLATAGGDRSIRLWDGQTGSRLYTLTGHTDAVTALAFMPGGQLVSGGVDRTVRLWNVRAESGDQARVYATLVDTVADLRLSPDGALLATACNDGSVRVWNASTGDEVRAMPNEHDAALTVAFAPKGGLLAVGGYDGSLTLYNVKTGTVAQSLIAPHRAAAVR